MADQRRHELLEGFLAQYKADYGCRPDEEAWDALAVCAAHMLSALLRAWIQGRYMPIDEAPRAVGAVRSEPQNRRKEQEQQTPLEQAAHTALCAQS
jgi:hypothetical protein